MRPRLLRVDRRDLPWLFGMGALAMGTFQVLWISGVLINGLSLATVIQCNAPVLVTILAWVFWREPLTWRKWTAIAMAFAGTLLIAQPASSGAIQITATGLLISLGSALAYGSITLFAKKLSGHYDAWTTLVWAFGFAALALLPFQIGRPLPTGVSSQALAGFAAFILITTIGGYSLYYTGLKHLQASVASIAAMTEVPFAAFLGYMFLGERLDVIQIVGAVTVVSGVLLLSLRTRHGVPAGLPRLTNAIGAPSMPKQPKAFPKTMPMRVLDDYGIPYEVHVHAHKQYTSAGVAEDLGVPLAQVVKAMLVQRSTHGPGQGEFAVIVIPGDRRLSLKKAGAVLGDKAVRLAAERDVIRVTGYQIGSVSVCGFRRDDIAGYVDSRVLDLPQAFISAARRRRAWPWTPRPWCGRWPPR